MFELTRSASFWWPIAVEIPQDGGTYSRETFDVQFRRKSKSDVSELMQRCEGNPDADRDFLRAVVTGWRGVTDGTTEVPFSEGALDSMLDIPRLSVVMVEAYLEALRGRLRKN